MEVCISHGRNDHLTISSVKGVNVIGNLLEIAFKNESDSFSAFQKIREFGVKCSHAGINSPDGPVVMMVNLHNSGYNLKLI